MRKDLSKTMGMTPVDQEVIPPPTADYTPFATKLKDAGPNWVYSWAPWVTQVRTLEALRKLDWQDDYIAWGHLEAEGELARLKDGKFFVVNANALFQEGLPIQKEIEDAAKKAGSKYPAQTMTEGWIGGMAIEAALKGAGWPADRCQGPRGHGKSQDRHQRPARRTDRVDQGQSLPHPTVLPRLQMGRRQDRACAGLEDLRREVNRTVIALPAQKREGFIPLDGIRLQLFVNIVVLARSTR